MPAGVQPKHVGVLLLSSLIFVPFSFFLLVLLLFFFFFSASTFLEESDPSYSSSLLETHGSINSLHSEANSYSPWPRVTSIPIRLAMLAG